MKKIAVTMGDPAGIGPEVVIKALNSPEIKSLCLPLVIGNKNILDKALKLLGLQLKIKTINSPSELKKEDGVLWLLDIDNDMKFVKGKPSRQGGMASYLFIKKAASLALKKEVDAIVTAPISKEALKLSGIPYPGHTEMLSNLTKTKDYRMMLIGGPLRVILVTTHTALRNVPNLITKDRVYKTILLAKRACDMLGIKKPKIAVSGLNPHAGEAGLFGNEEIKIISPVVKQAKKKGISVSGPFPPDTLFLRASRGEFDIVVSMYHDQGLIPLKLLGFETGVNVTVGLPIIRTSPDHGTAYDIAWKGIANPGSMIEAIKTAVILEKTSARIAKRIDNSI